MGNSSICNSVKKQREISLGMIEYKVGILGGMGSYATAHFFKRLLDAFPAEKEWDRPRIIIDNRCTMPSRVRAILYEECRDELIHEMAESIKTLTDIYQVDLVILACNTSHYFYSELEREIPRLRTTGVNLLEVCKEELTKIDGLTSVGLLASEGTIESGIYEEMLNEQGIIVKSPNKEAYGLIRNIIEDVKQNKITDRSRDYMLEAINILNEKTIILGCTELPVIYDCFRKEIEDGFDGVLVDPLQIAINVVKGKFKELRGK